MWSYKGGTISLTTVLKDIAWSGKETISPPEDDDLLFTLVLDNAKGARDTVIYLSETSNGLDQEIELAVNVIKALDFLTYDQIRYIKGKALGGSESINLNAYAYTIRSKPDPAILKALETQNALQQRTNTLLEMMLKKGYKVRPP
jgi:hypothetical protein